MGLELDELKKVESPSQAVVINLKTIPSGEGPTLLKF